MCWVNRLLTALLTLAIAQFGVLATAPAHAHEGGDAHHAVHAIEAPSDWSVAASDHHDHAHDEPVDATDGEQNRSGSDSSGTEPLSHVHSCPQFTQVAAQAIPVVALAFVSGAWPASYAGPPSHASAPPDRPPRAIL